MRNWISSELLRRASGATSLEKRDDGRGGSTCRSFGPLLDARQHSAACVSSVLL